MLRQGKCQWKHTSCSQNSTHKSKITHTMGKTPQFSCKMKHYIQNNVISSRNGILFSNGTHKPSNEYTFIRTSWTLMCSMSNTMMNGQHFFFIHHIDLGLFCSVTLTTQIHGSRYILFFPQNNVHSVHPNQHKVHIQQYTVDLQNNRRIYCTQLQ